MFEYDVDKIIRFKKNKPTEKEKKQELFIKTNERFNDKVTKIDGLWYYYKFQKKLSILNELIGTYLAKYIDLETVDYTIGINDKILANLSKSFREKGIKYINPETKFDTNGNIDNNIYNLNICTTKYLENLPDNIKKEMLKLIILDMYMGQYDRHGQNILFKKKNKKISLAPIYDYGDSFNFKNMNYCYSNPFVTISMNESGIERFFIKYPMSYLTLYKLIQIDIYDVLKEIEKQHNIKISDNCYDYYRNSESIKILKKFK